MEQKKTPYKRDADTLIVKLPLALPEEGTSKDGMTIFLKFEAEDLKGDIWELVAFEEVCSFLQYHKGTIVSLLGKNESAEGFDRKFKVGKAKIYNIEEIRRSRDKNYIIEMWGSIKNRFDHLRKRNEKLATLGQCIVNRIVNPGETISELAKLEDTVVNKAGVRMLKIDYITEVLGPIAVTTGLKQLGISDIKLGKVQAFPVVKYKELLSELSVMARYKEEGI